MTWEDVRIIGTLIVVGFLVASLFRIIWWWALDSKEWFRARRMKKRLAFEEQKRVYERLD